MREVSGLKKGLVVFGALACFLLIAVFLGSSRDGRRPEPGRLTIVASLFPQFDFARSIAGNKADVVLLLPPGVESHTFDPKPSDMTRIHDADIFIYTGAEMEPWAERVIEGMRGRKLLVVDASSGIELLKTEDDHGHHHEQDREGEEHEHDEQETHAERNHGAYDPHFWLNPLFAVEMVKTIEAAISEKDPANAAFYRANAQHCIDELLQLDTDIFDAVRNGRRNTLVFGGRFAYRYFLDHFGLQYRTVYNSCSTEAEPSVRDVAEIISYVSQNRIPCIYHEEFADPQIARAVSEATGASLALFSTAHNVTKDELDRGVTFVDIMRGNLQRIEKGLN